MSTHESLSEHDQESSADQASMATSSPADAGEEPYYVLEDAPFASDEPAGWSSAFAHPFQASGPLALEHASAQANGTHATVSRGSFQPQQGRTFPWLKVLLILAIMVVALAGLGIGVFASTATPLVARATTMKPAHQAMSPVSHPTMKPQQITPVITPTQAAASDWVPQNLPAGWTNAGLSTGDALFALRTAMTFTDREMSLDYRNVGTRDQHGGTFTAAVFILTPAARGRFAQTDLRAINNILFDAVEQQQLIQVVVNVQPRLVAFQTQGQQLFAVVDIAFQLWQSQLDQQHPGHRLEGKEMDPNTNQPLIHHMGVVLLRVTPGTQGPGAPMGGTGWLVSSYALDTAGITSPAIQQPA